MSLPTSTFEEKVIGTFSVHATESGEPVPHSEGEIILLCPKQVTDANSTDENPPQDDTYDGFLNSTKRRIQTIQNEVEKIVIAMTRDVIEQAVAETVHEDEETEADTSLPSSNEDPERTSVGTDGVSFNSQEKPATRKTTITPKNIGEGDVSYFIEMISSDERDLIEYQVQTPRVTVSSPSSLFGERLTSIPEYYKYFRELPTENEPQMTTEFTESAVQIAKPKRKFSFRRGLKAVRRFSAQLLCCVGRRSEVD